MAVLEWSGALALELPAMDEVHQEFVLLLAEVEAADDAQLCVRWDELIAHTQVHFDQEDRWMQSTRFTSTNCHSLQHKVVLQVMREGRPRRQRGSGRDPQHGGRAGGLVRAPCADHGCGAGPASAQRGLRSRHGLAGPPRGLPEQPITGCGGACDGSVDRARAVPA